MKTYKSYSKKYTIVSEDYNPKFYNGKIQSSKDSAEYTRKLFKKSIDIYESLFVVLLNKANDTVGWAKIGQGGISGTVTDMRLILKYAIEMLAAAMIIVHNHPSGSLNPSRQDMDITRDLKNAAELLDMTLLDHIILTESSHYSFADNGLIK